MARTVVGVFDSGLAARRGIEELVRAGIPRSDISLVAGDPQGEYARYAGGEAPRDPADTAAAGAVGGAVLGGVLGLLAGITTLAIPGIGPIIAAGPLAAALTGTALGAGLGAATGGLIGYLMSEGVPEAEANRYAEAVRRGAALVSVRVPEPHVERVEAILQQSGARDLDELTPGWEWKGATAGGGQQRVGVRPDHRSSVRSYAGATDESGRRRDEAARASRQRPDQPAADLVLLIVEMEEGGMPRGPSGLGYEGFEPDFRQHSRSGSSGMGLSYEQCAPAYRYGHSLGRDPRFGGREWGDIEPEARQRWEARNSGTWDRVKERIRYAWDRVRGKARAA